MRNGQNKRMRGRNRKGQNPLTRVYESNGPDVKIRGTASHVADKYVQLARDAQSSGDHVAAENYFQHAEHYFRLIAAMQEQFRQANPYYRENEGRGDASYDDGDDEGMEAGGPELPYAPREPQSQPQPPHAYPPREPQPYMPREPRFNREQSQPYGGRGQPPQQGGGNSEEGGDVDRLPAFVTGGGQPPAPAHPAHGQNGYEGQADRFPLHRRRRRRHGPRPEGGEGETPSRTASE